MHLFGTSKPSENTAREYSRASMFVSSLLRGTSLINQRDIAHALSNLSTFKGMINRCIKRDQWDWFFVYTRIGEPDHDTMRRTLGFIVGLRNSLKESISSAMSLITRLRATDPMLYRSIVDMTDTFISGQELSFAPNLGRLTLFSDKSVKGVTKITILNQSVWSQLDKINLPNEKYAPVSILHVNDLERTKILLAETVGLLGSGQPWTVKSDFRDLAKTLEVAFSTNGLLLNRN